MGLQHAIGLRFSTNFDVVSGLKHINAIVSLMHAFWKFNPHTSVFCLNMCLNHINKMLCRAFAEGSGSEVVNLPADENFNAINKTSINSEFEGSWVVFLNPILLNRISVIISFH